MSSALILFALLNCGLSARQAGVVGGEPPQAGVKSLTGQHVIVYYSPRVSAATAKNYLSTLDPICQKDIGRLQMGTRASLRVRVCSDALEFSDLTGADSSLSPLFRDGTLFVMAGSDLSDYLYEQKLETGAIRGLLDRIHQNGAPWWLINCAAVYLSGQYKSCSAPPAESVRYFADLDERIQNVSTSGDLNDLCFYLGATGQFFDVKFGAGSFMRLLQQFRTRTDFEQALKKTFNVTKEEIEGQWHEFIVGEAQD